jgi:epoxyqueuosine reductase
MASRPVHIADRVKRKWGVRIYGCQSCQTVCPFNAGTTGGIETDTGYLSNPISLHFLLTSGDSELKRELKPTALGMKWIDPKALKRNALIAAGNQNAVRLRELVSQYRDHPDEMLQETARWALSRIR